MVALTQHGHPDLNFARGSRNQASLKRGESSSIHENSPDWALVDELVDSPALEPADNG